MIEKIWLKNFQIHKKLEIKFDKNFNIIVGANDSGKSSIIRAIHWVFYNSPSGDWMRMINKDGEMEKATVKILFKDGTIIKRIKGNGINKYEINGEEYENFGFQVPKPILEKLRIERFETNKIKFPLHIAMQDDLPFLIHESSTVKASVLDVYTGMSITQRAIKEFRRDLSENSKEITTCEEEIEMDKSIIENLPDLNKAQEIVNEAKEVDEKISIFKKEIDELLAVKKTLKQIFSILNRENIDFGKIEIMNEEIKKLKELVSFLRFWKNDYDSCVMILGKTIPKVDRIKKMSDIFLKSKEESVWLQKIKADYEKCKKKIEKEKKRLGELEKELKKIYKDNPYCPVCERKWKNV